MSEELVKQLIPVVSAFIGAVLAGGFSLFKDHFSGKREKVILEEQFKKDIEKMKINLKNEREKEAVTFKRNALNNCAELVGQIFRTVNDLSFDLSNRKLNGGIYQRHMEKISEIKMKSVGLLSVAYYDFFVLVNNFLKTVENFAHVCACENDISRLSVLVAMSGNEFLFMHSWGELIKNDELLISMKVDISEYKYDGLVKMIEEQLDSLKGMRKELFEHDNLKRQITSFYDAFNQRIATEGDKLSKMMIESI